MRSSLWMWIWLACPVALAACGSAATAPDFTLRNDRGNSWTLSEQRGNAVLLTFGFTHCADTCPATLAKLSRVSGSLRGAASRVEIVFVTVDPARDDSAVLHRFVSRFVQDSGAAIVGLTGTPREIARVEAAYHVWSAPEPHGNFAHSSAIVLIDPRGRLAGIQDDDASDATLARSIAALVPS
jgi:protein SCO1/2